MKILNEQFVSAFTKEDNTSVPTIGTGISIIAPPLNVQVTGVKRLLLGQNGHKASGPDQISYLKIREGDGHFSCTIPDAHISSYQSYEQDQVPNDWKRAFVTPLFKKGGKSKAASSGQFHCHPVDAKLWNI